MQKISVCILVKNAQETLQECLESVRGFDEIILLDNGSTDSTLEIAREFQKSFGALRIESSKFLGFGALKHLAVSYARNDWVFVLDSDEVVESCVYQELESLEFARNHIYALARKNLYNKEWIKACGWSPDFVLRIFNKTYTRFNQNLVHESIIIPTDCQKLYLTSTIKHYAYRDIEHLLDKLQKYSTLWANEHIYNTKATPLKAYTRGLWSFIRNYFFKKGIAYGYKGFIISVCNSLGVFFKYMKLYELQKKPLSCSLVVTTYNQKERLALVLDSLKNLAVLPTEVVIADDGSTKDTRELIAKYQHDFPCKLQHVWQEDRGFQLSAIRNKAINQAQGEYIIVIDGDMILDSHFVDDYIKAARKGVFTQGSRVILDSKNTENILKSQDYRLAFQKKSLKSYKCHLLSKLIFSTSTLDSSVFDKQTLIKGVRGCSMGFFKQDFMRIGGFSQKFQSWGREDSEFVARFLFAGGEFRRLKFSAIAYHLYHDESPKGTLEANHALYLETIKNKSTFCKNS